MKKTLLITTILGGLITVTNTYAQECTAAPDCTSLGYTITDATVCTSINLKFLACPFDETKGVCTTNGGKIFSCTNMGYTDDDNLCPGDLLFCPHDYGMVKCIQDAQVGDLKYSWQTKNLDGWLLCDGSTFSSKQFPELYALLGTTTLPNYQGYFLKGAKAGADFSVMEAESLPNIKGSFNIGPEVMLYNSGSRPSLQNATGSFSLVSRSLYRWYHASGGQNLKASANDKLVFDASIPAQLCELDAEGNETTTCIDNPYQDGKKVNPENYPANIFIYAGKKAVRDTQRDKCKVGEWAKGTTNLNGGLKVTGCASSSSMASSLGLITAINGDTLTIVSGSTRSSATLAASSLEDCQNTFGGSLLSPTQLEELQNGVFMLGSKYIIYQKSGTLVSQYCTGSRNSTTGVWSFSCGTATTLSTFTSYTNVVAYCSYETNNAENTSVTWDWK